MKISINNKNYLLTDNTSLTILQVCDLVNIHIPRFCYHEKLSIAGNCRMCFVEIPKSKKPVLACSTIITNDLAIYTNTYLVKKAQESVLEFLLINHPLDCPICDQGGECDLQELTKNFGNDRGRFKEMKRSVEDLHLGNTIKTIMTRCIHCTRCIRFADEILNMPILGTSGRGRDTEVSLYIDKILHSELSGNLIDLCPVGALTSKPYAFTARPWELKHTESIDILDSFGSSIRIDTKGDEVMRILPKLNDELNEEWISDKIRFSYDAFKLQRLTMPNIKINHQYLNVSWNYVYEYLIKYFIYNNYKNIEFKSGNLIDLNSLYLFNKLAQSLTSSQKSSSNIIDNYDFRSNFLLNDTIENLESKNYYLIIGSQLTYENILLKFKINKNLKKNQSIINYIGSKWNSSFNQLSLNINRLNTIIKGKHYDCFNFYNIDNIKILCQFKLSNILNFNLINNLNILKNKFVYFYLNNPIGYIHSHVETIHSAELGFNSTINNKFHSKLKSDIIYNLSNHTELKLDNKKFIIFQGHHEPIFNDKSINIFLPNNIFVEKKDYYLNNFGMLLHTNKAINSPGLVKSNQDILFFLIKKLNLINLKRNYLHILKTQLTNIYSNIYCNFLYFKLSLINSNIKNKIKQPLRTFYFFHDSDLISSSSPMMSKLILEKKKVAKTNYYNTWNS